MQAYAGMPLLPRPWYSGHMAILGGYRSVGSSLVLLATKPGELRRDASMLMSPVALRYMQGNARSSLKM